MYSRLMLACLSLSVACGGGPVSSVVGPIVGGIVAERTAKSIIEDTRSAAAQLLAQGENIGNALIVTAGNELNVAADNASRILGAELDKRINQLSEQNRIVMSRLAELKGELSETRADVYELKDAVVLDVREMLSTLSLPGETFFIQRIRGVTQLEKEQDYILVVDGTGLGPNSEKSRSRIALALNGNMIGDLRVERTEAHRAKLTIPNSALAEHFDGAGRRPARTMKTVEATITIHRAVKERRWIFFQRWREATYSVPVTLSLVPLYAGTMKLATIQPMYEWRKMRVESQSKTTGNHHCEDDCEGEPTRTGYELSIKVPSSGRTPPVVGDQRLENPQLNCIKGPCGGWNEIKDVELIENKTRATALWDVWTKPTTWKLTVDVYEYQVVGEKEEVQSVDIYYGKSFIAAVPSDMSVGRITGKLTTGQLVDVVVGAPDPIELLTHVQDTRGQPGQRKLIYQVARPIGVD